MGIDENIMNFIQEEQERKVLPYKQGDILPVRITRLVDYGAFVMTKDEHMVSGLIHISRIPEDVELHVMQEVEAEVVAIKEGNKLEFSLMHHDKKDSPFAVLSGIREPLPEKELPADEVQEIINYLKKEFNLVSEESKKMIEEMVREMSVFRFTMILNKTLPEFKRDLVYHFLKEMKQRRDCL